MKFFTKILILVCLSGCVHVQGQECQRLLDSMNVMVDRGDFEIESLLQLADTACLREVGQQDSLYGDLMNTHGTYLLTKGMAKEALIFFVQSKAIYLKTRGFYSDNMGALYSNEGYAYMLAGQFQEAIAAFDTSILIKQYLQDTGPSLGISWLNRANALISLGRYAEAKNDLTNSIQNAKENHLDTLDYQYLVRINGLGIVLTYLGEWRESIPILQETVQVSIGVLGPENGSTILFINNLAQAYLVVKEYRLAEQQGEKALRLAEKVMPEHPQTNNCRQNLGVIYLEVGRYTAALTLLLKAKNIEDNQPGLDPATYSIMLSNIGMVYLNLNDYAAALPYFTEARERIAQITGKKSTRYAAINTNLSVCHYHLGNTELAGSLANESFELIVSRGDSFPDYEKYLSNTLVPLKATNVVLQGMKEVTEIVRKKFGAQSQVFAYFLMNYGANIGKTGQYQTALPILEQAEKTMRQQAGGIISKQYLEVLRNLAQCHEQLGNTQKSLAYFQEALALAEKVTGRENANFAFLLQGIAGIEERRGETAAAFAHYQAADTLYHRISARNFAALSDAGREAFLTDNRPQLNKWNSFAWRHIGSFPEISGLLFDDQLSEKGQLLHSVRAVLASLRDDSTLLTHMTRWLNDRQMIDYQRTLLAQKDTQAQYSAYEIDSLVQATNLLETYLTQHSNAFASAILPVGWRDVQASLGQDEVALEFFHFNYVNPDSLTDRKLYGALLLRPGDMQPRFIPLFEEKQLTVLLEDEGLDTYEWVSQVYPGRSTIPSELYNLIWQPLEPHLAGVRRVWFAPTGLLYKISLPAISKAAGERLLEKYDLQQLGSTREIAAASTVSKGKPKSALIYACISYPTDTVKMRLRTRECIGDTNPTASIGEGIPVPLPNTLSEADTVAARLQKAGAQVEIRIGYEALEEDARQIGTDHASPDFLMFATHGFGADSIPLAFQERFPKNNPMYSSWLLMAGSEQVDAGGILIPGFQDGILTAREVGDLNLRGTRLVILSACKSGLGAAQNNEGVYGLQRAFKIAGTQQVLATLWEIPDNRETQEFVGQFCERWLASGDARAALHDTQLDFYKKGKRVQVWGAWLLI